MSLGIAAQGYLINEINYTTDDGLSHNVVLNISEDSRGLIWLTTRYGVNRFDGEHIRTYTRASHGLHANRIDHILEDSDGLLWMLQGIDGILNTSLNGNFDFSLFDPYHEKVIPRAEYLEPELIEWLSDCDLYLRKPDGVLVFVSFEGFIVEYRGRSNYTRYPIPEIDTQGWDATINYLTYNTFQVVVLPGFDKYISRTYTFQNDNYSVSEIKTSQLEDYQTIDFPQRYTEGVWWQPVNNLAGLDGFYSLKDSLGESRFYDLREQYPDLSAYESLFLKFYQPKKQRRWVNHKTGLILLEQGSKEPINFPNSGLGDFTILSSRGQLYSTDRAHGFTKYTLKRNPFIITGYVGIPHRGLTMDEEGKLYVGTDAAYAHSPLFVDNDSLVATHSTAVAKSQGGEIWTGAPITPYKLGQQGKKLLRRLGNDSLQSMDFYVDDSITNQVWSIYPDSRDGRVWSATVRGMVYMTDPESGRSEVLLDRSTDGWRKSTFVHGFTPAPQGGMWLSTSNGVYLLDASHCISQHYSIDGTGDHFLPATDIHHMYIDRDSTFWLATGDAGLLSWRPNGDRPLRQFTEADGFPSMILHATYEDSLGFLWMPSEDGLVQMHKESQIVRIFRPEDGTSDVEYNRTSHYQHTDGSLVFGGITGATRFHPHDIHQEESQVPLADYINIIDVLQRDSRTGTVSNQMAELVHNNRILIRPQNPNTTLVLLSPKMHDRDYAITSQVRGWQKNPLLIKEGEVFLEGLPYGHHELELRALSQRGDLLEQKVILLTVGRPYYLQWWFIVLAFVIVAGLTVTIASLDNRRLRGIVRARTHVIEQQAEELRQLDELKSRFFANLSHELRTPLTLLLGPINTILRKRDIPEGHLISLQRANQNGKRLLAMVDDILDLIKLEDGTIDLHSEPVNLRFFLDKIIDYFSSHASQQSIKLKLDSLPSEQLVLKLDRRKVETILHNLLYNSLKHTPPEGVITLSAVYSDKMLALTVTDTGAGIDPRDLPYVFDRFYQARHTNSGPRGGTGIGLAICKLFAELHGGEIKVLSKLGGGSTFSVTIAAPEVTIDPSLAGTQVQTIDAKISSAIPTAVGTVTTDTPSPVQHPKTPGSERSRLLIVEDNFDLRQYLTEILNDDFDLETANNGQQAIEFLVSGEELPDLIITDLMMPVMDGMELLQQIKADPKLALLPVIVLTARAAPEDRVLALQTGIDDYLIKPFNDTELIQRIKNLLGNATARLSARQETDEELSTTTITTEESEWLSKVEHYIRDHLEDQNFGTADLAALLFISQRTLSRRLKLATGLTTNKYMVEIRLLAARDLLETQPQLGVDQVALAVGFLKSSYFSARFRDRFGVSPADYPA